MMELQSVQFDHPRHGLRRGGRHGSRWEGKGDVGEAHCFLTAASLCLLCSSVRKFISSGVHFGRDSFAFLGSFLLGVKRAENGEESWRAEHSAGVSGG